MSPFVANDPCAPPSVARLLAKYGPRAWRYRVYPPEERLDGRFGAQELLGQLASRGSAASAPLSVCVRWPPQAAGLARSAAEREIATHRGAIGRDETLAQVRWEGEAVRVLGIGDVSRIMEGLRGFFELGAGADCALEADAADITPDWARTLAAMGFNEITIRPRARELERAISTARGAGFRAVALEGVKAIAGPGDPGLDAVIVLRPDRVSIDAEAADPAELTRLVERLQAAGYVHLGYDRFAAAGDDLSLARQRGELHRGPWGYCALPPGDVLGIGPSATTNLGAAFSQNHASVEAYGNSLERGELPVARGLRLDDDGLLRREVIERLSCEGGVDFAALSSRFGIDPGRYFEADLAAMDELVRDEVVRRTASGLEVTPGGRFVVGAVCGAFERAAGPGEGVPA